MSVEVVPDEVEQVVGFEGDGFVARIIRGSGGSDNLLVRVPMRVVRKLRLTGGSIVEVLIRKVSEEYCMEKYGEVPKKRKQSGRVLMKCPRCGRLGIVGFGRHRGRLVMYFDHFGVDGETHKFIVRKHSKMIDMVRRALMLGKNFKAGRKSWCRVEGILRRLEGGK